MSSRISPPSVQVVARPAPSITAAWRLEFIEGPNAGAVLSLLPGRHRLGRADGNDILLADPLAADQQAEIQVEQDGRRATMHALSHGLLLGRRRVRSGAPAVVLRDGAVFRVGATRVRAMRCRNATANIIEPPVSALRAAALAPVVLVLILGAAWAATHGSTMPPRPTLDTSSQPLSDVAQAISATASHAALPSRTLSPETVAAALRHYIDTQPSLQRANGERIQLSVEAGALIATGAVADRDAWSKAQAWFDATYAGRLALVDRTTGSVPQNEEAPILELRAVSVGAIPYLILADGSRLTEGGVLRNGWIVEHIAIDRVVLRRHRGGGDERTVEIGL